MKRASREFRWIRCIDEKARDTHRVILILRLREKIKGLFNCCFMPGLRLLHNRTRNNLSYDVSKSL